MNRYRALSVKELQLRCRDRGLPVSGKKGEIIERLEQRDRNIARQAERVTPLRISGG